MQSIWESLCSHKQTFSRQACLEQDRTWGMLVSCVKCDVTTRCQALGVFSENVRKRAILSTLNVNISEIFPLKFRHCSFDLLHTVWVNLSWHCNSILNEKVPKRPYQAQPPLPTLPALCQEPKYTVICQRKKEKNWNSRRLSYLHNEARLIPSTYEPGDESPCRCSCTYMVTSCTSSPSWVDNTAVGVGVGAA